MYFSRTLFSRSVSAYTHSHIIFPKACRAILAFLKSLSLSLVHSLYISRGMGSIRFVCICVVFCARTTECVVFFLFLSLFSRCNRWARLFIYPRNIACICVWKYFILFPLYFLKKKYTHTHIRSSFKGYLSLEYRQTLIFKAHINKHRRSTYAFVLPMCVVFYDGIVSIYRDHAFEPYAYVSISTCVAIDDT